MTRQPIVICLLFLIGLIFISPLLGRAQVSPPGNKSSPNISFEFYPDSPKVNDRLLLRLPDNYHVYETGTQRKVITVNQEPKPLHLIFIFGLGADATCSVSFEKFVNYFVRSMNEHLRENDKVSIFSTDQSSTKVAEITLEARGKKTSTSSLSLIAKKLISQNLSLGQKKKIVVCDSEPGEAIRQACYTDQIVLQNKNYWGKAVQRGIDYLRMSKDMPYRNVIILANSINNIVDQDIVQKGEVGEILKKNNIVMSWIGKPLRHLAHASPSHFSYEAFLRKKEKDDWWREHVNWEGSSYFEQLVSLSGGQVVSCEAFSPASTIFESSRYKLFSKGIGTLINNLRTRYRITYESDNSDLTQPRNIKLEMSSKWKGGKVTLHYPKIIYPQTPEK